MREANGGQICRWMAAAMLVATIVGVQLAPAIAVEAVPAADGAGQKAANATPAVVGAAGAETSFTLNRDPAPLTIEAMPVVALAMSSHSDRLASGGDAAGGPGAFGKGAVRVWDVKRSSEIVTYPTERGVSAVAISSDGRLVAWSTWANDVVLRTVTGEAVLRENVERPAHLAFSPDGKLLVAATEGQKVLAWNVETGKRTDGFAGDMLAFCWVDFSPDGKLLVATGGMPGQKFQGNVWDVAIRRQLYRLPGNAGQSSCGAISSDSQTLATNGVGSISLWDLSSGKLRNSLTNTPAQVFVNGVARNPNGQIAVPNVGGQAVRIMTNGAIAGQCVALSPDGLLGASGDLADGSVMLWDPKQGRSIGQLRGHAGPVRAVAFAHDGKTAITGSVDCSIRLWNVETKEQIGTLDEPHSEADSSLSVAYSPDGARLAAGQSDGRIRIAGLSPSVTTHGWQAHGDATAAVAWSPDGRLLASSGYENDVKLWNPATGELVQTLRGHQGWNVALAFSPDGQTLASGSYDRTIILWNVADGKQRLKLSGHTGPIRALAVARHQSLLASGGGDGTVKLWDMASGRELATLTGHRGVVRAVAFSADDRFLASAGEDGLVRLWNVETHELQHALEKHADAVVALAFVEGALVSASSDHSLRAWNTAAGTRLTELNSWSPVLAMAAAPDGKQLVTSQSPASLVRWEAIQVESSSLAIFGKYAGFPWSAAFSSNGTGLFVAAGGSGNSTELYRYELATKEEKFRVAFPGNVRSIDVSPAGDLLALGYATDQLVLVEAANGRQVASLEAEGGHVNHVAFSSDGKSLVTSALDNQVRIYDVENRRLVGTLRGHSDWALSLAVSPDGKGIVSTSRDGTAIVWDGTSRYTLPLQPTSLESVAWSPDGKTIATGGNFGAVKLWDAKTGAEARTLTGNRGLVYDVNFSPDGQSLVTAGEDHLTRIWDLATGKPTRILGGHSAPVTCARFSPDGKTLVTTSTDGTVRLWAVAPPPAK